jgi:hypothetical protein
LNVAIFLISRRSGRVNVPGRPPLYFGYNESKPSALKLRITSRTRSGLADVTPAIVAAGICCAGSSTICARRQVTTGPVPRRAIRRSLRPSSTPVSRTLNAAGHAGQWALNALIGSRTDQCVAGNRGISTDAG